MELSYGSSSAFGLVLAINRALVIWFVPAFSSIGFGANFGSAITISFIASCLEVLLWVMQQKKKLRFILTTPLRWFPYPIRYGVVGVIQIVALTSTDLGIDSIESQELLLRGAKASYEFRSQRFDIDADLGSLAWNPKTISVILPCAEERDYALKTVQSVYETTPTHVLHEIIVVDDGSSPALADSVLPSSVQAKYKVKVIRLARTRGLIIAKKTGGDAATGDISVFFDCHVAPQKDWYMPFLALIGENYRRLVVPQITDLDVDTWAERNSGAGVAKCYLTWDADFKWYDSQDQHVAVISGGLLGMSRRWWFETGGYDEIMVGRDGENLDQSLRVWLCGGEIVTTTKSRVAHMWRTGWRSRARYWPVGDPVVNRARAVHAWFGEFVQKLDHFPKFSRWSWTSNPWYGNVGNILEVKDRLKCRSFTWFLRRFKALYEDAGLLPIQVFMLREKNI